MDREFFDFYTDFNDESVPDDFAKKLVERALKNEHIPVSLINNIEEYMTAKYIARALKKLVQCFKNAANTLYKQYLDSFKTGRGDFEKLVDFKVYSDSREFYAEEYKNTKYILDEFKEYM